jgi:hypothetical protein
MKRFLILISLSTIVLISLHAQNSVEKVREIGLNLKSGSNLGLRFESGKGNNLFKITMTSFTGYNQNSKNLGGTGTGNEKSFAAGIAFGFERRKLVTNKIYFYFGPEISSSFNKYSYNSGGEGSNSRWTIEPGLGFTLGLLYAINENLIISSEIVPSIWYSYGKNDFSGVLYNNTRTTGFKYGLISPGASLTFSYRFIKKS